MISVASLPYTVLLSVCFHQTIHTLSWSQTSVHTSLVQKNNHPACPHFTRTTAAGETGTILSSTPLCLHSMHVRWNFFYFIFSSTQCQSHNIWKHPTSWWNLPFFFFSFLRFIYLFVGGGERKRTHAWEQGEGQTEREGEFQADSLLSVKPNTGLNVMTLRPRP